MYYMILTCIAIILFFVGIYKGMKINEEYYEDYYVQKIKNLEVSLKSSEADLAKVEEELIKCKNKLYGLTTIYDQYSSAYYEINNKEDITNE